MVVDVLKNPVIESGGNKSYCDDVGASVFPEPTVNSSARCDKCAMELVLTHLVVPVITLEIIRADLAFRQDIRHTVKVINKFCRSRPGIDKPGAFLHVVLDLHSFTGLECNGPGIDIVSIRLREKGALHHRGFSPAARL